ncbi:cupin domain-containing protein [Entomohabitans teleogrylli]|uniref:cupin domain-containing protein n=1 Tax=Entomohabitans teleogrylli TaxID=1384589 RepID=UPI00073D596F|nr:cupin domain-containing protein [Entomohabitans teleogrylli]
MKAFKLHQPIPELQPIGRVSLLGATPTDGDPQVAAAMIYGAPQDAFTCGLFSATRGGFTMIYPFTEHATVLEGEVELTVAGSGKTQRFQPGDSWFVEQGTEVQWKVVSERFVKHYLANVEHK